MTGPPKRCPGCGVKKPWTEFYTRTKWPDGSTRNTHTRCKDCMKARRREQKAADPEDRKEARRARHREYLRALPEVVKERYREKQRLRHAERRRELGQVVVPYRPRRVTDHEAQVRLPIGPFREWLAVEVSKHDSILAAAVVLGVPDDNVRMWLTTRRTVLMDDADKCFCRVGKPWLLAELYPEIYDFESTAA